MSKRTDIILYNMVVTEQRELTHSNFMKLNENDKSLLVDGIVKNMILGMIDIMKQFDTGLIDKTRGEIRRLGDINVIVNALDNMPSLVQSLNLPTSVSKEIIDMVEITTKCMSNIYNEVRIFKSAYSDKKVLLMMKYQTLINSFISTFTTLSGYLNELETNKSFSNDITFDPILGHVNNMKSFNADVLNGKWKVMIKDTEVLRESFIEVDSNIITESSSLNLLVGAGLQALTHKLDLGFATIDARGMLYKLTGVVMLVLSLREVVYAIYNSRVKFGNTLKQAIDYAELQTGQSGLDRNQVDKRLQSLKKFTNMFVLDQDSAYKLSKKNLDNENKHIVKDEINSLQDRYSGIDDSASAFESDFMF